MPSKRTIVGRYPRKPPTNLPEGKYWSCDPTNVFKQHRPRSRLPSDYLAGMEAGRKSAASSSSVAAAAVAPPSTDKRRKRPEVIDLVDEHHDSDATSAGNLDAAAIIMARLDLTVQTLATNEERMAKLERMVEEQRGQP